MPLRPCPPMLRALAALVLAAALSGAAHSAGPRLIVRFDDGDVEAAFSPSSRVARLARDAGIEARLVRRMAAGAHLVELPEGTDARAAAAAAMERGGASLAVRDRRLARAKTASDPDVVSQPYLANDATAMSVYDAWDITTGTPSVVVAVVDSGVLPHPELAARLLPGYDFVSDLDTANDGDGRDADATDPGDWISQADVDSGKFPGCARSDSSWHGTGVAGVIAANANNGKYIAGLDWGVRVLPLRVLGKCDGSYADIYDAIAWAAGLPVPGVPPNPHPAQVINLSLGGISDEPCTAAEDATFAQFLSPGGVRAIVAAAGNDSSDANLHFPSSCPSVISVAATTFGGNRTSYSNYGASVDVAAPGGEYQRGAEFGLIAVLANSGMTAPAINWIKGAGGTSFAAPMVSGVATLMLSVAPDLSPQALRAIVESTVKPFPATSLCTPATCGRGIVNARAAASAAQAQNTAPIDAPVVEYYNAGFGHYFMTAQDDEIDGLDGGAYNRAFLRTGASFSAWASPAEGTVPVCRFFTVTFAPKSSHFYTADPAECELVKHNPDWQYEKIAFHIRVPAAGVCGAGTVPVYRMYNNGQTGAPNHRFTTEVALYQEFTTTKNWSPEGIAFCAPQ